MATAKGVAVVGEPAPMAVQAPADILHVIARAAADPATDVDKLERLMGLYERLKDREAVIAYSTALAQMQSELPLIGERGGIKDRNGNIQSAYSLWEDVVAAITPILSKHGFSLAFRTGQTAPGTISVTGVLTHSGGHSVETKLDLPVDTSGSKNAVQAVGSSVSYGKRYTASALLNLRTGERDDDGQAGGGSAPERLSEQQVADLDALLTETGANKAAFLKYCKVNDLSEILSSNYKAVCDAVRARARAR